jgi:hypothetical protein
MLSYLGKLVYSRARTPNKSLLTVFIMILSFRVSENLFASFISTLKLRLHEHLGSKAVDILKLNILASQRTILMLTYSRSPSFTLFLIGNKKINALRAKGSLTLAALLWITNNLQANLAYEKIVKRFRLRISLSRA